MCDGKYSLVTGVVMLSHYFIWTVPGTAFVRDIKFDCHVICNVLGVCITRNILPDD